MSAANPLADSVTVSRCDHCHGRFVPRVGPCPVCGSAQVRPLQIPARGHVLGAVELLAPARGWRSPHRIALIEGAESVRFLAVVEGEMPQVGTSVRLSFEDHRYVARAKPVGAASC